MLCPKIFTRARDWPRLSSAHPNWAGASPKNLNRENLKFGLKFSVCTSITLGLMAISSQIFTATCREPGVITWVQFLDGLPPKNFGGQKTVQNLALFLTTFDFDWSRISPKRIHKSKIGKVVDQLQPLPRWTKKRPWTLVHKRKSYWRAYWPTQVDIVRRLYFGPYGVMFPQIFIRARDCIKLANADPNWDGDPPPLPPKMMKI